MGRPLILLAFALALFALPAGVSAQKGMGPPGGKSGGGQQCQKGTQQAYQPPQQSPNVPYANAGYPVAYPSYPSASATQSLNPTTVTAIRAAFAMLKTVVGNLTAQKIDNRAAKALAVDLKTAVQIGDSRALTNPQKEARILRIMDQVVADLKTLASDNSLSLANQMALAEVVAQFQQLNQTAQQSSQLAARASSVATASR